MRGRYGSADAVEAAKNHAPLILCKTNRQMERGRNGARYFRNPPQPHMCIQDFIENTNMPCFINVLSWQKISTPRRPEDPIPLYGGMRVPHNSSAAMSLSSHFGAKVQPVIFAVMANPEILRLSGKTAPDPSDRDALVELMIDFVEAMNPDVRFKREFTVLKDRDLAGELKDIWLAVQAKRERERGENGRREAEKFRENKDEQWREEVRQRGIKNDDAEVDQNMSSPVHCLNSDRTEIALSGDLLSIGQSENVEAGTVETGEVSSLTLITTTDVSTTPSTEPLNRNNTQHIGAMDFGEQSVYSMIRSHYEQEFNRTENCSTNTSHSSNEMCGQSFHNEFSDTCFSETHKQDVDNVIFPVFSENAVNEPVSALGAASHSHAFDDINTPNMTVHQTQSYFATLRHQETKPSLKIATPHKDHFSISECPASPIRNIYENKSQKKGVMSSEGKSCQDSGSLPFEHKSVSLEGNHMFSAFTGEAVFLNNKAQVPNTTGRSHEDLLPVLSDASGVKYPVGSEHNTVAIP